jgi:zinc/manganese transport system substrate-binding protein
MKRCCILLAFIPILIIVSAMSCQSSPVNSTGKKKLVVTYSILSSVVKELVGNEMDVIESIPDGLDPHDWEPSARDIEAINKAGLVVCNGLGLESGLEKTLEQAKKSGVPIFYAAEHIQIRYVGLNELPASQDPGHNHEDEHQSAGAADPHLWTDPVTMSDVVKALSEELKADFNLDFSSQAAVLQRRLSELDKEVAGIVKTLPPEDRKLVTGHESMGYFAQRYGFQLSGVIVPGLTSQAEVSAADLAELKAIIMENRVKAVFTELGTSAAVARAIGEETGVRVVELTTHALPEDGSYFTFIRELARVVTEALK